MERCSRQGVNPFLITAIVRKTGKSAVGNLGVLYGDPGKQNKAEQMYSIALIGLLFNFGHIGPQNWIWIVLPDLQPVHCATSMVAWYG
jgi:hypothetical protein